MTSLSLKHQAKQTRQASATWCVKSMAKSYLDCSAPSLQTVRPFAINLEAGT